MEMAFDYIAKHPYIVAALFAASSIFLLSVVIPHYKKRITEERISFNRMIDNERESSDRRIQDLEARLASEKEMYRRAVEVQQETNEAIINKLQSELDEISKPITKPPEEDDTRILYQAGPPIERPSREFLFLNAITATASTSAATASVFEKPLTIPLDVIIDSPNRDDPFFGGIIKDHSRQLDMIRSGAEKPPRSLDSRDEDGTDI